MHEYERDLQEINRLRSVIQDVSDAIARMIRARDNEREVRTGKIRKLSYHTMQLLSQTYISGISQEASRLEAVLSPEDLEEAAEIIRDIEDIVEEFASEELDEEDEDENEKGYYEYG